jgi:hypothetical protein
MAAVFNIIMMPFEFVLYLTISFLDTVLMSIMAVIEELAWIKNQISGIFEQFYNKIVKFVIPIIEITVHIRDMLGKINGIVTAALYMIINIYNITVSGVINLLTMLINLLLILIASLVLMIGAAALLFLNPLTVIPAIALEVIITACLIGVVLPAITITAIMHSAVEDIFNESSPSPPKAPSHKKKH